jgi:ABC-type glutathione transport system ATPase component
MYMRLGFAVAINVDPDVLLVDEVLAVGDEAFTHKCLDKFAEFRRRGKTVLLVTHSLDLVTRFCDEALWLDSGRVRAQGDPQRVIGRVSARCLRRLRTGRWQILKPRAKPQTPNPKSQIPTGHRRPWTETADASAAPNDLSRAVEGRLGIARSRDRRRRDDRRRRTVTRVCVRDRVAIRLRVHASRRITDFVFGIGIFNSDGVCCYGTNTDIEGATPGELSGDGEVVFAMRTLPAAGRWQLQTGCRRAPGRTAPRTIITACCTRSASRPR